MQGLSLSILYSVTCICENIISEYISNSNKTISVKCSSSLLKCTKNYI